MIQAPVRIGIVGYGEVGKTFTRGLLGQLQGETEPFGGHLRAVALGGR